MKNFIGVAAVALTFSFGAMTASAQTVDLSAAKSIHATKQADCNRQAKAKRFGVHFIKRNRFIKQCMAS
jgi:hypothetical protein